MRDQGNWLLGSVYRLEGSAYRKPGSFMLMNDEGTHLGLLSGGCLESDLMQKARAFSAKTDHNALGNSVTDPSPALSVRYDSTDQDDLLFQLGLGCGGIVDILLQPLHRHNDYLNLAKLHEKLTNGQHVIYEQHLLEEPGTLPTFSTTGFNQISSNTDAVEWYSPIPASPFKAQGILKKQGSGISQYSYLPSPPHIVIFGGGEDAIPLSRIARQLGWHVSVVDARPANARAENFGVDINLVKQTPDSLTDADLKRPFHAVVIMNHSVDTDAASIQWLLSQKPQYCAMLGPKHRRADVLDRAGTTEHNLPWKLNAPAGYDIGADLPESIALAILAQCHEQLYKPQ